MINFPSSPTLNQEYSFGDRVWKYNGTGWALKIDAVTLTAENVTDALGFVPVDPGTLATVATTGDYDDLINTPTLFDPGTLATVATTGDYDDLTNTPAPFDPGTLATVATTGDYDDLINTPTLFDPGTLATVATTGSYNDLLDKPTAVSQVNSDWNATSGVEEILNKPTLFSGAYSDLTGKPTLGTAAATDVEDYATAAQGTTADAALPKAGGTMTGAISFAAGQTWPTFNQDTTGNAATATNVAYSGLTGTVPTWNQNTTGNAATATALQTARNINGVSFNGTANITVADATKLPLAGGTMTGQLTTRITSGTTPIVSGGGSNSFQVMGDVSNGAWMSFHRGGAYAVNLGMNTDNVVALGGWSDGGQLRWTADTAGNFVARGNVTAYSDERLKKDWAPVANNFIEQLAKVKHGTYTRTDSEERQMGVSAQTMKTFAPEAVMEDSEGKLSLAYGNAALIAAVKLAERVIALESRLAALEAKG